MRILVTTNNLISHFRPMLPFALGLKERGHDVRVAAHADLAEEIISYGFGHIEMVKPTDEQRADLNERAQDIPREKAGKFWLEHFFMRLLPRVALPALLESLEEWRPDLILRESTEFAGLIAAQKIGVRHVRFEIINGESEESIATNYAEGMSEIRQLAGLDPVSVGYLRDELSFSAHPQVLDDTPRVNSKAPFRFRSAPLPLSDVTRPDWFPANDKPLVYMTFGTVAADNARAKTVFRLGLEAVADLPINVLMTTGGNPPADLLADIPPNVIVKEFVPQTDVLPHVQLMVCHGGSGTVLGGLAAGAPMVIVPLFADQPDNARCLSANGLCMTVKDDASGPLREAIMHSLNDSEMHKRAKDAAQDFAAMPTLDQALDQLIAGQIS